MRLLLSVLMLLVFVSGALAVPVGPGTPSQGPEAQAMAQMQAGQPEQAIEVLKKALGGNANSPRLHYQLGLAYAQAAKPDLAQTEFETVLKLDPDFVEAHLRLAELSLAKIKQDQPKPKNLQFVEAAIKQLQIAISKNPQDKTLQYTLAEASIQSTIFREQGSEKGFEEALKALEALKAGSPEEVRPYLAIGNLYLRNAQMVAGEKKYKDLGGLAPKVDGLLDKAVVNYQKVLSLDPKQLGALSQIAQVYQLRDKADEAVKIYAEHMNKVEGAAEKSACYRSMAQIQIAKGDLETAEKNLNEAIKTNPQDLTCYLLLSDVFVRRQMMQEAVDVLGKSTKVSATFLNAYVQIGTIEAARQNFTAAIEQFTSALNVPPGRATVVSPSGQPREMLADLYSRAAVSLSEIYVRQSNFDEAVAACRKLANIMPNAPLPEYQIGEVFRRKGDNETAKEHYENALRRVKNFVPARAALAELTAGEARFAGTPEDQRQVLGRAIEQYQMALDAAPDNVNILDRLVLIHIMSANLANPKDKPMLEKALSLAKKASELAPDSLNAQLRLAQVQYDLGNKADAVNGMKKVIQTVNDALAKDKDNAKLIFQLADLKRLLNVWQPDKALVDEAVKGFADATAKDPQLFQAYMNAASMLEQAKDYAGAVEWDTRLFKAVKGENSIGSLSPDRSQLVLQASADLAWLYAEYLNDLAKADEYAKIAMSIDSKQPGLIDTVGWICYKKGQFGEAIPLLREAYRAMPTNATIAYHLGAALVKNKNPESAKPVLQDALKNVGDDATLKKQIEGLLKDIGR